MGDWQDLEKQLNAMTVHPLPGPGKPARPALRRDPHERPSVFVKFVIAGGVFALCAGVIACAFLYGFSPMRPIPDYRRGIKHQAVRSTGVDVDPDGIVWISSAGQGAEPFEGRPLWWGTPVMVQNSKLGSDILSNVVANKGTIQLTPVDGPDFEKARRGADLATAAGFGKPPVFWPAPFLALDHAGNNTDLTLSSVERGPDDDTLFIGTQSEGIHVYKRLTRQWLPPFNVAAKQLGDDHVHDLYRTPFGVLVAHDLGIDVCRENTGKWTLSRTIGGLASHGVAHLYPISDPLDPAKLDLWYASIGKGVGAVTLSSSGSDSNRQTLISERAVPSLTEQVCRDAAFNNDSRLLWVAFLQNGQTGLARYRFADHDWLGTQKPLLDKANCIATYGNNGLLGTDEGVIDAFESNNRFETRNRGPAREKITEVVDSGKGVVVHSQGSAAPGDAPTRIRRVGLAEMQADGAWQWNDLLGPRRFAGLADEMMLCVAAVPGKRMHLFGTRGRGIGAYFDDSHELVQLYHGDAARREDRLPDDTIGDIACRAEDQILAVTGKNALLRYDGKGWDAVLTPAGMPGTVESVSAAAGNQAAVVIAADPNVGIYDMAAHAWKPMPPLAGIARLAVTKDRLWALDQAKTLRGASIDGGAWKKASEDVAALSAAGNMIAALAGKPGGVMRLLKARDLPVDVVVNPKPLDSPGMIWRSACAEGKSLYLGGAGNTVALYDFTNHQWQSLGWPAGAASSQRLEATRAGLWMLDAKGRLYLWKRGPGRWNDGPVLRDVRGISCDDAGILAVISDSDTADNQRLVRLADESDRTVYVGKALRGGVADTFTAVSQEGSLFLGSRKSIARYAEIEHDWANYPFGGTRELVTLCATNQYVYALARTVNSTDGRVYRYSRGDNAFAAVRDPANPGRDGLAAALLAADDSAVAIRAHNGDVLVAQDARVNALEVAFPSSAVALGRHKVTCAAEWGQELALGSDDGSIWDYCLGGDRQLRWAKGPSSPSAVNKIIAIDDRKRFVIHDASIESQTRDASKDWKAGGRLIGGVGGCDAWLAADNKLLYGGTRASQVSDKNAGAYSEVGYAFAAETDPQKIVGGALLDNPMPLKSTAAAAELRTEKDKLIFRADTGGMLARYSMASHAWEREEIGGITRLISSIGTVWAFAPVQQRLYRFNNAKWSQMEGKVVDAVGDNEGLLVRMDDGSVRLLSRTDARQLIGTGSEALAGGWKAPRAFVEFGDALICALGEKIVCAYDLKTHGWTSNLCEGGISEFLKSGAMLFALPAETDANVIWQWSDSSKRFVRMSLPFHEIPIRLLDINGRPAVSTKVGGLYLWTGSAWVTLAGSELRLPMPQWGAVACAGEAGGKLVLGLKLDNAGAIVRWDPQALQWKQHVLDRDEQPLRFLPQPGNPAALLVVCMDGKGRKVLLSFDAARGVATPLVVDLGDVIAGGLDIWCLSAGGSIARFDPATRKFALPEVGAFVLPGEVRQVKTMGNDLVAVLSDNSVWHHDVGALGWRLALAKPGNAPQGFQRQAKKINGRMLFTDPSGDMLLFDNGKYVRFDDDIQLPAVPQADKWNVIQTADRAVKTVANANFPQNAITNGALASDVIKEIAWSNGSLYCRTAAGPVRVLDRQMQETAVVPAAAMGQLAAQPSPLALAGSSFTCAVDPKGLWPSAQPGVALKIAQKQVDGTAADLVPYAGDGQCGLDFQWIQSAVYRDAMLLAAIPGGTVRASIVNDQIADLHLIGRAPSTLAVFDGVVYCKTDAQILMFDRVNKRWAAPANANAAKAAFDAGAELAGSSAVGPVWALQRGVEGFPLELNTADRKAVPVSIDARGFGFDIVAGMSLRADTIELYTRDGLVTLKRQQTDGRPESIDRALAVPAEMLAQAWQAAPPVPSRKAVFMSADGKFAWGLGDKAWDRLEMTSLLRAQSVFNPRWLNGQFCKWSRDEKVEFNGTLRTEFLLDAGRFGIDQVFSIAVFARQSWAITRSGICRLGDNGAFDLEYSDPACDWSKGGKLIVTGNQGQETLYARVTMAQKTVVLRYAGGRWQAAGPAETDAVLKAAADELLRGQTWRVRASDLNGPQRQFERHWNWSNADDFTAVRLLPEQGDDFRFDFERINALEMHGGVLWIATDGGVMHVDPAARKMVYRSLPDGVTAVAAVAVRHAVDGKKLLAARAGGKTLAWSENAHAWAAVADAVWFGPQPLVDSPQWKVRAADGKALEFQHLFADGRMMPVALAPSGAGRSRFDFDTVNAAAGSAEVLAVSTDIGLVERLNDKRKEVFLVLPRSAEDDLFTWGPRESQEIICRSSQAYFRHDDARRQWLPVPALEVEKVRSLRDKMIAWNATWQVQKKEEQALSIMLKLPEPAGGDFQPVVYSNAAGLFTFDLFNDVALMNDNEELASGILLATEGGLVRMDMLGEWRRLYNDAPSGIVAGMSIAELAGLNSTNLMAAGRATSGSASAAASPGGSRTLFKFVQGKDVWESLPANDDHSADQFARLRSTLADDEKGWRVLDLGRYRSERGVSAASASSVSLSWQGQPVWLANMENHVGFAHDIILSAALEEEALWLGTAGGMVKYAFRPAGLGTIDWDKPAIHASDLLSGFDPWSPPAAPRIEIVRTGALGALFACHSYQPAAFHMLRRGLQTFAAVDKSSADLPAALQSLDGIDDAFWHWRKTGAMSLSISFQQAAADAPADYQKMGGGTFRFFDAAYHPDRTRHQRTMETIGDRIFLATAGGVTSFDAATWQPVKVYAQADAHPLRDVSELWFDRRGGVLYARGGDGTVFSRPAAGGDDRFSLFTGSTDPFADANIIVDNSLLKWRQFDDKAVLRLNCSDILPGAAYDFFHEGKFSFDYVQTMAFHDKKVWMATMGGVVRVDRASRQIEHIYVRPFPYSGGRNLPGATEIVTDPGGSGDLCARTDALRCFRFADPQWQEQTAAELEPSFRRAYTRIDDPTPTDAAAGGLRWTWVQPLNGIYVELRKTSPADLDIGAACPTARVPLMSRARFSWDDLREAVLTDDQFLFSTPAGVCCYSYNAAAWQTAFDCLYADAAVPGSTARVPMIDLERLVRDPAGLTAWNRKRDQVFVGKRAGGGWEWTLDPRQTPGGIESKKTLNDGDGSSWTLEAVNGGAGVRVTYASAGGSARSMIFPLGKSDAVEDLSKAKLTDLGLFFPSRNDVIWIDKGLFAFQTGAQAVWVKIGAVVALALAIIWLIYASRKLKLLGPMRAAWP
jgi:hypothetical protein